MSDSCKPLAQLGAPLGGSTAGWPGAGTPVQNANKHFGDIMRGGDVDPKSVRYDQATRTLNVTGLNAADQRSAMAELIRHPDSCHISKVDFGGGNVVPMPQRRQ